MISRQRGFISAAMLGLGRRSSGDPNFASVVLLALNENGADGTTTFDDASNSNHTLTANGNVQWDTAQAPTGLTSSALYDGAGDFQSIADHDDWSLGSGDWTVEGYIRYNGDPGTSLRAFMAAGQSHVDGSGAWSFYSFNNQIEFYYTTGGTSATAKRINGAFNPADATWYHVAACRNGANGRVFVDGTQVGTTFNCGADSIFNPTTATRIGADTGGVSFMNGWLASWRVTKGVARYTANFTPPNLPLPTI